MQDATQQASSELSSLPPMERLIAVMKALRTPETGCPWDLEQTFATIAPYTIEEAYEVADAIERADTDDLKKELGDLLFQVVFHAQLASEENLFSFPDVAEAISEKMINRHPHVFSGADVADADAQTVAWEEMKARERAEKAETNGVLDDVARTLPAMIRSQKLQKRAARVRFDWPDASAVMEKVDEELSEVKEALASGDTANLHEEIGDLMFVLVNLCRKTGAEAEDVLKSANDKFTDRFAKMEKLARESGDVFAELSLQEQEKLWQQSKLII